MQLNSIRLLITNFNECFKFYSEKLGLKVTWGKLDDVYASFDVGQSVELSIFTSDLMAQVIGNFDRKLPSNTREKFVIVIKVESVDKTYEDLSKKGVLFINKPININDWQMRVVHLYDPEMNLIEFCSDLIEE